MHLEAMAQFCTLLAQWKDYLHCLVVAFLVVSATAIEASVPRAHRAVGSNITEKVHVHIIAHSHDDVGWLKTVDEYYYGTKQDVAEGAVQYILDSVITELEKDPKKRFSYVEMAFLYRWWREQTEETRSLLRRLVSEGRLELVNGGWCMNDEGATHYNGIIDQMTLGHSFILSEFGSKARPRIAWQIDPFGHSAVQAALFAEMAFDGLYLSRVDYEDKALRVEHSRLEMVWRGSPKNLGQTSDLFTGLFYKHYAPPKEFCFDPRCSDPVVVRDDPHLQDVNVDSLVEDFVKMVQSVALSYRTSHIMVPMGDDFNYASAGQNFKNIDKMIEHLTADGRVNAFYSTPWQYVNAVHEADLEWELKTDDFFPYADHLHSYWTGYYTSRPALKRYIRTRNSLLQTCKQIEALTSSSSSALNSTSLRQAVALAQHHDAVTGTERQRVAGDYAKRLSVGSAECELLLANWADEVTGSSEGSYFTCRQLNISVCKELDDEKPFSVFLYNPLAHPRLAVVRLPVTHSLFTVPLGEGVLHQVDPVSEATIHVRGDRGFATHELVLAAELQPSSVKVVQVVPVIPPTSEREMDRPRTKHSDPNKASEKFQDSVTISNEYIQLSFSSSTGRLSQMRRLDTQQVIDMDQQFLWYFAYNSSDGHGQPSGAYIFRPANNTPFPVNEEGNKAEIYGTAFGEVVQEVRQKFSPWVYQTVRLYKGQKYVELEYTIGPIPVSDLKGKEIISRFWTSLHSGETFFTDSNGREMQERIRDHRPTWKPDMFVFEKASGNYYPVNSRIFLQDQMAKTQFTILTDSSQGGSSLINGSLELMLHRRLLGDDGRGLEEPLNELGYNGEGLMVHGKHYIVLSSIEEAASLHRPMAQKIMLQPLVLLQNGADSRNLVSRPLMNELPPNVHLLTLQTPDFSTAEDTLLIRLEHYFEVGEDATLSQPVSVNLTYAFQPSFDILSAEEMTLTGTQPKADVNRLKWKVAGEGVRLPSRTSAIPDENQLIVELQPMDIRSFRLRIKRLRSG